ncbi:MAG: metallophosphoesterase [Thermoplasmatales archaeon]|nr:metallophosphoesterase [Candidatus Thermoplasmatota archaeon]MCL6003619.1 metallophosphoesterase [Candidatus Thermoplasmatota archaeon]MDA8054996.1 metallophosphoesterase [Thermoplasmatales archaeon]
MDEIEIENNVFFTRYGAAYLEDISAVVVSDVHLGYEDVLAMNGIFIPRVQSKMIYDTTDLIIKKYKPEKFIIDGDLKHEFSKNTPQEWRDVYELLKRIDQKSEPIVIKGNHDNYVANIASKLNLRTYDIYEEGRYTFHHGHKPFKWDGIAVIGNEHPAVGLRDSVDSVLKLHCFLYFKKERLIVLPAMSIYAGGSDILKNEISSPVLKKVELNEGRVYGLWDAYGTIDLGNVGGLL